MDFEWDAAKSDATFARRGVDFAFAAEIFAGFVIESVDARVEYGERRIRAIGQACGVVLVVVFTDRGDCRRIISARRASERERMQWLSLSA
jgi:uncharacterized DUF497 family protein